MTKEERQARRELWQKRVAAFRSSGQSVAAWCREHEIKEHQMRYWLRRSTPASNTPSEGSDSGTTDWMPVPLNENKEDGSRRDEGVWVHAGGAVIEVRPGTDAALVADLVRALTTRC